MDSESDSIASDDGGVGGKKEDMKKSIFVKRRSNETAEENTKHLASKNPFSVSQTKKPLPPPPQLDQKKKKTEDLKNLNLTQPKVVCLTNTLNLEILF